MAVSRAICLLNCLDPLLGTGSENYARGAVLPSLWEGGWPSFYSTAAIAHLWEDLGVGRFCLYCPWGVTTVAGTKTIGYDTAQAAVTSRVLGPRQAEDLDDDRLVNGLPSANLPSFTTFWQGTVADFTNQGGEIMCYQGAPPSDTSQAAATIDAWVQEAETCNMAVGLDGVAATDRLSYATPASVLADRLAVRRRATWIGQNEAVDPRVNAWADGRFSMVSGKTRADLVWGTPASYNVPALGKESVVLLTVAGIASAATRLTTALAWIGRTTRGSPWSAAVEVSDFTDAQIVTLVEAGG